MLQDRSNKRGVDTAPTHQMIARHSRQTELRDPTEGATDQRLSGNAHTYKQTTIARLFSTAPTFPKWWQRGGKYLMPNPSVDPAFLQPSDDDMSMSCDQAYTLYLRGLQRGQIDTQRKWIKVVAFSVFASLTLGFTGAFMTTAWIVVGNRQQATQLQQNPAEDTIIFEGS